MIDASVRKILVVDDEMLIAVLIEDMLADLGYSVVGPAFGLNEAISLAQDAEIDGAILDLNLDGRPSFPVAHALRERRIPFAFATGYEGPNVSSEFDDIAVLQKPFTLRDIAGLVDQLFPPER